MLLSESIFISYFIFSMCYFKIVYSILAVSMLDFPVSYCRSPNRTMWENCRNTYTKINVDSDMTAVWFDLHCVCCSTHSFDRKKIIHVICLEMVTTEMKMVKG